MTDCQEESEQVGSVKISHGPDARVQFVSITVPERILSSVLAL